MTEIFELRFGMIVSLNERVRGNPERGRYGFAFT